MENIDKIKKTILGLKKYNSILSELIKIVDSNLEEHPSGGIISESEITWTPTIPNEFLERITEQGIIELGFYRLNYPEFSYQLNEETSLILVCAEGKWYGAIHQFQGLKPPMDRVYIPKDLKTINDVKKIIDSLTE